MIKEKYKDDINGLLEIAKKQEDRINLSLIMMTLKCDYEELNEIVELFTDSGIEIINEDVEPDSITSDSAAEVPISPFDPTKISIETKNITIDSIIKRIIHDEIEFDSSFQRKAGLWKTVQKSQLIESIILRIPLPAFYFDASVDDKLQIIDGLQRIGTINEYVVKESFRLTGMEFLKDLNGLKYSELPRSLQRRIEETMLYAYFVGESTPKNVKFNIFKRINTGGLVLEPQEIRNALYQGQAASFLFNMAQSESFKRATCYSIKSERMLDREFCLRFVLAVKIGLDEYNGNFDEYMNSGMEYLAKTTKEDLDDIMTRFERAMRLNEKLFGKFAFRRLNDELRRGPINKALFAVWSYLIDKLSDNDVEILCNNKTQLMKKFTNLCLDTIFVNYIKSTDKTSMKSKYTKVEELVERVLEDGKKD